MIGKDDNESIKNFEAMTDEILCAVLYMHLMQATTDVASCGLHSCNICCTLQTARLMSCCSETQCIGCQAETTLPFLYMNN